MGWWIALGILTLLAILPLGVALDYDEAGLRAALSVGPVRIRLLPQRKKSARDGEKQPHKVKKSKKKKQPDYPPPELHISPDPANPEKVQAIVLQSWPPDMKRPEKRLLYLLANGQDTGKTVELTAENKWSATVPGLEPGREGEEISYTLTDRKPKGRKTAGGGLKEFLPLIRLALDLLQALRRKLRVNELMLHLSLAGDDPCDLALLYGRTWAAVGNLMPQLERFLVIRKRDIQVQCDFTGSKSTVQAAIHITMTLGRMLWLALYFGLRAIKIYIQTFKRNKKAV